jgi:hypothetical protein
MAEWRYSSTSDVAGDTRHCRLTLDRTISSTSCIGLSGDCAEEKFCFSRLEFTRSRGIIVAMFADQSVTHPRHTIWVL